MLFLFIVTRWAMSHLSRLVCKGAVFAHCDQVGYVMCLVGV